MAKNNYNLKNYVYDKKKIFYEHKNITLTIPPTTKSF